MDLSAYRMERLREDGDLMLQRGHGPPGTEGILVAAPLTADPPAAVIERLHHEYSLRGELGDGWAVRPLAMADFEGRPALVLADPGGRLLDSELARPLPVRRFLGLAIGITAALRQVHQSGLIHRDVRPANIVVGSGGQVRLTGFGLASRLARERQTAERQEILASSLGYMAPEQSGRLNRSIDHRSDLYSLGATFYEMLVGSLPFTAANAVEWVYSHVARVPPPPSVRVEGVPDALERIILKLLAKNAEDRYQTAAGVEHDLRRCSEMLQAAGAEKPFRLGERDIPSRFVVPEKLYGRDGDVRALIDAFDAISEHSTFDFLLVSGEPGIGKSTVVGELRRAVYAVGGLFASGKFDQYKRNVPYATLSEAFHGLFRHLLGLDDAALDGWRSALQAALGPSGQLMVELFPELALIIGEQPPVPKVSPQEAKNRFNLVFSRFIGVFAQPEHPLVLFLDDLQWLDGATLELLQLLAGEEQIPNLLLLGAYRSSEVDAGHPLQQLIDRLAERRGGIQDIRLQPLRAADVASLIADAFQAAPDAAHALGELVFEKAQGNPFFTVQFLTTLSTDGLIQLDPVSGAWTWDVEAIGRQAITDNVAALLTERLRRFEGPARGVAAQLACLGEHATSPTLAALLGIDEADVDAAMRDLVAQRLVQRVDQYYRFAHDGVREAAYALIPAAQRPSLHLAIGRLLQERGREAGADADLFGIVDHLNRAADLIRSPRDRRELAGLNLAAGKRAKAGAAYGPAINYLRAGVKLLGSRGAADDRLRFDLESDLADCEFMTGEIEAAEQRLARLSKRSRTSADLASVVGRQLTLYVYLGQFERAIGLSLECLRSLGVDLPLEPTEDDLLAEYRSFRDRLGEQGFEALLDLPEAADPRQLETMSALAELFIPAAAFRPDLHYFASLRLANLTLAAGLTNESAHAFACIAGQVLGWRLGTFDEGKDLARLTLRLVEERGFDRFAPRVYAVISGTIGPWSRTLSECYTMAVRATEIGREQGSTTYSGYAWGVALTSLLDSGRPLAEVERHAEASLAVVAKLKWPLVSEFMTAQLMMVRALRGETQHIESMSAPDFDEADYAARLEGSAHLWHALVRYRIRRMELNFIARNITAAVGMLDKLAGQGDELKVFELVEYHFFAALTRAAVLHRGGTPHAAARRHRRGLQQSFDRLVEWRALCPENFDCRAELVGAEMAALDGKLLEAEHGYENAIALAREHGFTQVEALANELAARFYTDRSLPTVAAAYLERARTAYDRWGAAAKVRVLERQTPALSPGPMAADGATTPMRQLDLSAAVEMYQTLSREIVLDRLIERLMVTVVEHAGARRGLLLLSRDGRLRIVAEAETSDDRVTVGFRKPAHFSGELPESVLNYACRTREVIIIDDALAPNAHSADAYILRARPRSILCLPLVKQARLVGMLYLENDLASHIFTEDRVAVLQLVASQAAISIENAELFADVRRKQEELRQAGDEVRRSFDMIPALAWSASPEGLLEYSNKQWHDFTGIPAQDARGGSWMRAFHPDDVAKVSQKWRQLLQFRASGEFEARMRRSDGAYRRFLIRLTPMCDARGDVVKWHGTNTDIDDLKRAEEAQEALARASRVTAMGALTVSIAHEINQPLMAIVTNAATCMRWLDAKEPNVPEARLAAERVIRDGHRAGDVIASIRAMARNAKAESAELDLVELVREVLALTGNELERYSIAVDTRFRSPAQPVVGDRTQIQQVLLNLVLNGIEAIAVSPDDKRLLEISTEANEPGFATVAVADSGIGLKAAEPERIFDAFYTTKSNGVGIGLSICRSIIETHGGRIWAQPRLPRGSIFHFSLPILERQDA